MSIQPHRWKLFRKAQGFVVKHPKKTGKKISGVGKYFHRICRNK